MLGNYFSAVRTRTLPILLAVQVSAVDTKFASTKIAAAHVINYPIEAIFAMCFVTSFPLALNDWVTPATQGFVAVSTCRQAFKTDKLFATFTFSEFLALLARIFVASFTP